MPAQTRSQTKNNQQNVQKPVKPKTTDFDNFIKAQETRDPVLYQKLVNIKGLVKESLPSVKTFNPDIEPEGQIVTVTIQQRKCVSLLVSFYDKSGLQYCTGRMIPGFAGYTEKQTADWRNNGTIPSGYEAGKSFDAVIYRYCEMPEQYWLGKV